MAAVYALADKPQDVLAATLEAMFRRCRPNNPAGVVYMLCIYVCLRVCGMRGCVCVCCLAGCLCVQHVCDELVLSL